MCFDTADWGFHIWWRLTAHGQADSCRCAWETITLVLTPQALTQPQTHSLTSLTFPLLSSSTLRKLSTKSNSKCCNYNLRIMKITYPDKTKPLIHMSEPKFFEQQKPIVLLIWEEMMNLSHSEQKPCWKKPTGFLENCPLTPYISEEKTTTQTLTFCLSISYENNCLENVDATLPHQTWKVKALLRCIWSERLTDLAVISVIQKLLAAVLVTENNYGWYKSRQFCKLKMRVSRVITAGRLLLLSEWHWCVWRLLKQHELVAVETRLVWWGRWMVICRGEEKKKKRIRIRIAASCKGKSNK